MDSSMCSSAPDPEMWIIQGTLAWRTPPVRTGVRRFTSRARSLVQVQDGPAAPGKRIEEVSDYFMHAPLGSGDIAQLVELRSCNWVVAITGWMSNCPGVGVGGSLPGFLHLRSLGKRIKLALANSLDALSPFNPLSEMRQKKRKENPWTDPIISTP
nr:ATP synthase subunit beta, chloroplastic-like [Ipomoea batatas]